MSGAVLVTPTHPDADLGAFFITTAGYLPACVHSSIGVAVAGLSTGFIETDSLLSADQICMEIPSGMILLRPIFDGDVLRSVAVRTAPAFVQLPSVDIDLDKFGSVEVSVVYSGAFFVLVDVERLGNLRPAMHKCLTAESSSHYAALGAKILDAANRSFEIRHPEMPDLRSVNFVMFFENSKDNEARDIVINACGGVDRTPCGAGMGAKLAELFSRDRLLRDEPYVLKSFLGTQFTGRILESTNVGPFEAIVPEIEGTAYITGLHQFVLDSRDPYREGLVVR
jgi:proline racemase